MRGNPISHLCCAAAVAVAYGVFTTAYTQGLTDTVAAGAVSIEPATPHAISIRWPVVGDKNLNATIDVAYRKTGTDAWLTGHPLFRTFNERVSPDNAVAGGHLFAGSIVDLEPDIDYEVRLSLNDRDGGSTERIVTTRTAAVPRMPDGMRQRYVVPLVQGQRSGGTGSASDPFRGLRVALSRATAGDLLVLAAGVYADAAYSTNANGSRERPIIIRGPADAAAILDGGGKPVLLSLSGRQGIWLDRLTLRNAETLVEANKASRIYVTRSRFELRQYGFLARGATYLESTGFYIADNVFIGETKWPRTAGIQNINAITVTGAGHVISHNFIRNVADGVHNGDDGRLSASDIHNNEIETCTDDAIEVDYSDTNVRVYRNRITNCFAGVSAQPVFGGPVYIFRNTMLNLEYSPFKLHNDTAGLLIFHNTSVKSGIAFAISNGGETVRDVVTRNNLLIGTVSPALHSTGQMARTDFDNDAYAWPGRGDFAYWNNKTFTSPLHAKQSNALYFKLGVIDVWANSEFASGLAPPASFQAAVKTSQHDPRLSRSARSVDRGVRLPNFNDAFTGAGPDIGCCELGHELPHFGPRHAVPYDRKH